MSRSDSQAGPVGGDVERTDRIKTLIEDFVASRTDVREFWREFSRAWPPSGNDHSVGGYDSDFFDELADRLHYTDFDVPPDPHLQHPEQLRSWLSANFPRYVSGAWSCDDRNAVDL